MISGTPSSSFSFQFHFHIDLAIISSCLYTCCVEAQIIRDLGQLEIISQMK